MQERNAQMALRLHQMTGEPLAHCSYLLDQTKGDYETALKILERILEQRKQGVAAPDAGAHGADAPLSEQEAQAPPTLERRVEQLEMQLAYLTGVLTTMSGQLSDLLGKLADPGPESGARDE